MSYTVDRREVPVDELVRLRRDVLGLPENEAKKGLPPAVADRDPAERPDVGRSVERGGTRRGGRGR